jgi:hypothetical protein
MRTFRAVCLVILLAAALACREDRPREPTKFTIKVSTETIGQLRDRPLPSGLPGLLAKVPTKENAERHGKYGELFCSPDGATVATFGLQSNELYLLARKNLSAASELSVMEIWDMASWMFARC